ncbi:cytochrome c biogenesis CcdA family protein [Rossellomorea sp. BNER]|uniref:cytochrome c biogenesis CcdA family protein n=1 Tax=Rossellomorea sp. BNER TaxID=2962031 RepID=UPI003AF3119A|nr:cytochrome c biogenesis CcdA family protein [Rossellomorea sp. BNER]
MQEVSIWFAFFAGVLSFFSPCVFPLLPAYVSHLTGGTVEGGRMKVERSLVLTRSVGFIVGFSIIFVIMGASASFLGELFTSYRFYIEQIAGILIILFGLQMVGWINLSFLLKDTRKFNSSKKGTGVGSLFLGMAFASGWSPCVGITLSSILLLASSTGTLTQGILLLVIYSLGLAIPFIMISFSLTKTFKVMGKINKILLKLNVVNGVLMIILGFLVFSGKMQQISAFLAAYNLFI